MRLEVASLRALRSVWGYHNTGETRQQIAVATAH